VKMVVTCQPAIGHFHAVAPLALSAAAASHEVVVVTGRGMGPWVEQSGLRVIEVGPSWLADGFRPGAFDDPRRRQRLMSLGTSAMIPGLLEVLRDWAPDVVLHESLEWAAPLAADAAGIPFAALGQLPRLPRVLLAEVLAGSWDLARSRLGLAADPTLSRLHPYLYLDAYLPSMQPLTDDPLLWFGGRGEDDVAHLIQPPLYQAAAEKAPDWLAALPDRGTVYVTMGTAFNAVPRIFSVIVDALRDEDLNVIVTVGRGVDIAPLQVAPNIHVTDYIAQSAVLARADVVVQHSGYLTIVGALAHALPMVLIPVAVDQPYHAHRLAAAGAAIRLDPADLDAARVRGAVREALGNPLYRMNAGRLQAEMSSMPSLESGIDLVARLAATRQPVLAAV
jgi:UDP:flavonoid glycosyltransferase YjiC (YdhE family)